MAQPAGELESVVQILGGPKLVRKKVQSRLDFVVVVREGLRYGVVRQVAHAVARSDEEIIDSLGLARRTLARRKKADRLNRDESEKVLQLATIAARATDVLGSGEAMQQWLRTSNRALGGASPLELLDTDVGAQEVLNVLGRLEHGVFS